MTGEGRSTRELWPDAAYRAAVEDLEGLPEEIAEVSSTLHYFLGYCSARHAAGRLTDDDIALLRDLIDVARQFAKIAESTQAHLERRRQVLHELRAVPTEWHMLLDPSCPENWMAEAAAEYGARAELATIVHARRWQQRRDVLERELDALAHARSASRDSVLRDLITQAAHIAALEARQPQPSVTITVLGERRQYRRGREGDALVPIRDLPLQLVWRWARQSVRRYVLEQLDPGGPDAEALADAEAPVVVVRIDPEAPIDRSGDRDRRGRRAVRDIAAPTEAASTVAPVELRVLREVLAQLDETDRAIAERRGDWTTTHKEIAAELGMTPAAVRKRWSRLSGDARRLLSAARASHTAGSE